MRKRILTVAFLVLALWLGAVLPVAAEELCIYNTSGGCTTISCYHADRIEFRQSGDNLIITLYGYRGKVVVTYC